MKRQAMVIGLGQFGLAVARALTAGGVEVLAVDVNQDRVRAAATGVTEAAVLDATDEEALARTSPERRDVCVCAIGDESKEASILCTTLLKQMGAKRLISRANDDLHARILTLVGADRVVNPEREFGDRFINQILHAGVLGEMALGEDVVISEFAIPAVFVGHSLSDLALPRRHQVTVVAIRRAVTGAVEMPSAEARLGKGDVLVVVARDGAVGRLLEQS